MPRRTRLDRVSKVGLATLTLALVILTSVVSPATSRPVRAQQSSAAVQDNIILLDITASMVGEGSDPKARDIWSGVLGKVREQISNLPDHTNLAIVPFANGPRLGQIWPRPTDSTQDPLDLRALDTSTRASALAYIADWQSRKPDGQSTWICDSLEYALQRLSASRAVQPNVALHQNVFLYTDGADNGRCEKDFVNQFSNIFNGQRGDYDFLYVTYVDINQQISPEDRQRIARNTRGGTTVLGDLPPLVALDVVGPEPTAATNLNDVKPVRVNLKLANELPMGASFSADVDVSSAAGELTVQPSTLTIQPSMSFEVRAARPLAEGPIPVTIRLTPRGDQFFFANSTLSVDLTWQPVEVELIQATLDLGNLARAPAQAMLRLSSAVPDGRTFTADVVTDLPGLTVQPTTLTLASAMPISLTGVGLGGSVRSGGLRLRPHDTTFKFKNGDRVPFTFGWAPIVDLVASPLADTNLADQPQGVSLVLTPRSPLPNSAQPLTAHVEIGPKDLGLRVEPTVVTLGSQVPLKIYSETALAPGAYTARLHFVPDSGEFDPRDADVQFTWQHNPPRVALRLDRASTDFGTIAAGSVSTDPGSFALVPTFDLAAVKAGATADLRALVNGEERPDQLWFAAPNGQHLTRRSVGPADQRIDMGERIDARTEGRFWPGTDTRVAAIEAQPGNTPDEKIQFLTAAGLPIDRMDFTYQVEHGITALVLALLALLVTTLILVYVKLCPRFPVNAALVVDGGGHYPLRSLAETSFARRWCGGSVTIGSPADNVDVSASETLAIVSPKAGGLGLFGHGAFLRSVNSAIDPPLEVDGEPLTGTKRLRDGAQVVSSGLTVSYQVRSRPEESDDPTLADNDRYADPYAA
jgi:hypothetical protein